VRDLSDRLKSKVLPIFSGRAKKSES
jgi:hypothetical protein